MAFEYGEQRDSNGNITQIGTWSATQTKLSDIIPKIIENFRSLKDDSIILPAPHTHDTEFGGKADKTYVDTQLSLKAEVSYVDTALALKVDKAELGDLLFAKADKAYVTTNLALKADAATTLSGYKIADAYTKNEIDLSLLNMIRTAQEYTTSMTSYLYNLNEPTHRWLTDVQIATWDAKANYSPTVVTVYNSNDPPEDTERLWMDLTGEISQYNPPASEILIADADDLLAATNVEQALKELALAIQSLNARIPS